MAKDVRGPEYPKLTETVQRYRRKARNGLKAMSYNDRLAYGTAVEKAILALQKSEARSGLGPVNPRPRCASGTWETTGDAIHEAILRQQRRDLMAYPGKARRARKPEKWQEMYDRAMAEKRRANQ